MMIAAEGIRLMRTGQAPTLYELVDGELKPRKRDFVEWLGFNSSIV